MPGLSNDPDAAQRQLAGLAKGRRALALSVLGLSDEQVASLGAPEPPAPAPAKAPAKARQGTPPPDDDDRVTYPEPKEPSEPGPPAPEPEPERRPGFVDGLLGRL